MSKKIFMERISTEKRENTESTSEEVKIDDSNEGGKDTDVNINNLDGDHEGNAGGDGMEGDVKDEDPMERALNKTEKYEDIDEELDETIDPSYYDPHFKPAVHDIEEVIPRTQTPREEVEETRKHAKRDNDEKPAKAVKLDNSHDSKKSSKIYKTEGEKKKKSSQKSSELSMEISPKGLLGFSHTNPEETFVTDEKKKERKKSSKVPDKSTSNEKTITNDAEGISEQAIMLKTIKKRRFSVKAGKEQPKKQSNRAFEISPNRNLQASAEKKAKETKTDERKGEHENVRKKSEKEPKKPRKGTVEIPKKEIRTHASKGEEKPKEKKEDEPRGLKKSGKEPVKVFEKGKPSKQREYDYQGHVVKSLTSNEAVPGKKHETKKEPQKSQSVPKKALHRDSGDVSQPKASKHIKEESQRPVVKSLTSNEAGHSRKPVTKKEPKVLNPKNVETKGREVPIPMDVDEREKEVEGPHEVHKKRKRKQQSAGASKKTRGGDEEPSLEQGEIGKSDKPGEEAGSGEKPKTQNRGKGTIVPPTDCRGDCYKQYQKDVPDRWEPVNNFKTFDEYIHAFEKRYACYLLVREQLLETIKLFEGRRRVVDNAKIKDDRCRTEFKSKYAKERTTYLQRKKAYVVLHKELDNLRTHLCKFYEENSVHRNALELPKIDLMT